MKKWKKLAATLLLVSISLLALTACGGGEKLVRDTNQEKNITLWIQESMKEDGYELATDAKLDGVLKAAMPKYIESQSAQDSGDDDAAQAAYQEMEIIIQARFKATGKNGYSFSRVCGKGAITKDGLDAYMQKNKDSILEELKKKGVDEPKSIAVNVTKYGEYTYLMWIISD